MTRSEPMVVEMICVPSPVVVVTSSGHSSGRRQRGLAAAGPVADRLHEEALALDAEPPGALTVVEHDRRAERGEVLVREVADLLFGVALGERLAVDAVLLGDLLRAAEAQHQRADSATRRLAQALLVGARHVEPRVRDPAAASGAPAAAARRCIRRGARPCPPPRSAG